LPAVLSLFGSGFMAYIGSGLTERIRASTGRIALAVFCASLAAICAIASGACAIYALWIFALPRLGPVGAPLGAAAALLGSSIALLVVMQALVRLRRRGNPPDIARLFGIAEATRLFKENKGAMLVAALVAGLIAGSDRHDQ
jgi:hypothetical protein